MNVNLDKPKTVVLFGVLVKCAQRAAHHLHVGKPPHKEASPVVCRILKRDSPRATRTAKLIRHAFLMPVLRSDSVRSEFPNMPLVSGTNVFP